MYSCTGFVRSIGKSIRGKIKEQSNKMERFSTETKLHAVYTQKDETQACVYRVSSYIHTYII